MTRDEARALFATAKLDYSILTMPRVQRLRTLINAKMKTSGLFKGEYRCRQRPILRPDYAEIRCKASYFDGREAITFNKDGFIGFAGWADEQNVQPVLSGFAEWVREVTKSVCSYEIGDWQCREGGYLWYAGDGEGYDPEDTSDICPCCRTKDFLEAAKEEAESCSSYSNCGDSGTGVDIWASAEKVALRANPVAAAKALQDLGVVAALEGDDSPEGYSVVLCNTQAKAIAVGQHTV